MLIGLSETPCQVCSQEQCHSVCSLLLWVRNTLPTENHSFIYAQSLGVEVKYFRTYTIALDHPYFLQMSCKITKNNNCFKTQVACI